LPVTLSGWTAAPGRTGDRFVGTSYRSAGSLGQATVTHAVALTMLGRFELAWRGRPIRLPASAERVVAYVALHDGPATRSNVAGSLWLDVPEDRAMANLRSTLWRLRRPGVTVIEPVGQSLALSANVAVDLHDLRTAARALADGVVPSDPSRLDRLTAGGELLGDWYDDWVLVEREHFRQLRLQALERISLDLTAVGQFARAIESALAAVATEPLRESAHRALISVHLAQGNRSEAVRQYCIYRRLMREELDLAPSTKMDELMEDLPAAVVDRATRLLTRA
jgi:DNA-binding SARP family transcriptional activator